MTTNSVFHGKKWRWCEKSFFYAAQHFCFSTFAAPSSFWVHWLPVTLTIMKFLSSKAAVWKWAELKVWMWSIAVAGGLTWTWMKLLFAAVWSCSSATHLASPCDWGALCYSTSHSPWPWSKPSKALSGVYLGKFQKQVHLHILSLVWIWIAALFSAFSIVGMFSQIKLIKLWSRSILTLTS